MQPTNLICWGWFAWLAALSVRVAGARRGVDVLVDGVGESLCVELVCAPTIAVHPISNAITTGMPACFMASCS